MHATTAPLGILSCWIFLLHRHHSWVELGYFPYLKACMAPSGTTKLLLSEEALSLGPLDPDLKYMVSSAVGPLPSLGGNQG